MNYSEIVTENHLAQSKGLSSDDPLKNQVEIECITYKVIPSPSLPTCDPTCHPQVGNCDPCSPNRSV